MKARSKVASVNLKLSRRLVLGGMAALVVVPSLTQASETKSIKVRFKPGQSETIITGRIEGRDSIIYVIDAKANQFLTVSLRPDNQAADYNIYIPGRGPGDEALFVSAIGGREYRGQLYKSGKHVISVFMNRAAARRNEIANYDILIRVE